MVFLNHLTNNPYSAFWLYTNALIVGVQELFQIFFKRPFEIINISGHILRRLLVNLLANPLSLACRAEA